MSILTGIILLLLLSPIFLLISVAIRATSNGKILFRQYRTGKNKKPFLIYKFRTMTENAENIKTKYKNLNEADGPVFKIKNDPRFTKIGKRLAHSGLDELPQLINIIKGEMTFVGPRPLPISEANKVPEKYALRFSVLPGITSPWVIKGAHNLKFNQWMKLDLEYVQSRSTINDIKIAFQTASLIFRNLFSIKASETGKHKKSYRPQISQK